MEIEVKIIKVLEDFLKDELGEFIELNINYKLFGGDGPLDSIALVNLLVDLEEFIEDEFGITISLADEKAMSRRTSPFSRVKNLVDYIQELIEDKKNE